MRAKARVACEHERFKLIHNENVTWGRKVSHEGLLNAIVRNHIATPAEVCVPQRTSG